MATTPCPHCGTLVEVQDDKSLCPGCRRPLRFIEVPERPCACGASVPLPPRAQHVRCPSCNRLQAADPRRALAYVATCPRCRRRVEVDGQASGFTCHHCGTPSTLHDTV